MHQILIVEDDSDIAESLRYSFRREGFLPVAAESGEKGFTLALREKKSAFADGTVSSYRNVDY